MCEVEAGRLDGLGATPDCRHGLLAMHGALFGARARRLIRCVAVLAMSAASSAALAIELKLASVAPEGSAWVQEMRAGAALIDERTEGRVQFKFYPGGIMGNEAQVLRKMRVGQLHGGVFAIVGLADRYPSITLYSVPLMIRSLDEVDHVRARIDPKLQAGLEQAGLVSFGFIEGGFAHMMGNEPIRGVADMRRRKVWIPEGDQVSFMAMEALGLSPVALPITDVLTGMQTGLLDIVAASPVVALVLQWHTRIKYVTDLPAVYSMGIFALDGRVFERLSAGDQQVVREVMTDVVLRLNQQAREDNARAREVMENLGIEFVPVNPVDVAELRDTIAGIYPELIRRNVIDSRLFDELLETLAAYRRSAPPASGP